MTMITPSYLGETIEYSSLHACRSTLEDPTMTVAGKEAPANSVPAAAVIRRGLALFGFTGRKARVGGVSS